MTVNREKDNLFARENESLRRRVVEPEAQLADATARLAQHELPGAPSLAAAEKLRQSEASLRVLTESLPHLVWTCLADGPCDFLSRQWIEYTGIPEAAQLGYGWLEQIHPDDRERAMSEWRATVVKEAPFDIEVRIRRHDGVYRWFKTRMVPLKNVEGKLVKWYGSNTDIEDLRRAQAAMSEAEERSRTTLYSIGDAVISTDAEGRVQVMNRVAEELTGWSEAEAKGRPTVEVFRIVNEETRNDVESPVERVLREGVVVGLANHSLLIDKDGGKRPIADSGAPIRDENGNVTGVVLVFRDQSEERAAQKALLDSERLSHLIADYIPALVSYIDHDRCYRFVNQRYAESFRKPIQDMVGKPYREVVGEAYYRANSKNVEAAFSGKPISYTTAIVLPGMGTRWMRVSYVPDRDEHGSIRGIVVLGLDITNERRQEHELLRLTQALAAIRNVNQLIVREHDPARLIEQACGALVQTGAFSHSWLFLVDDRHEIASAASAGFDGIADPADLRHPARTPGCLDALEHAGALSGESLQRVCDRCPHAEAHPPITKMVARLSCNGHARGVLGVGFADTQKISDEQRSLLIELAGDLDYALRGIEEQARRWKAEEALRASEKNLQMAEQMAHVGYWNRDIASGRIFWSPETCRIYGFDPNETGFDVRNMPDLVHPEDRSRFAQVVQEALAGRTEGFDLEFRILTPDGAVRWLHSRSAIEKGDDGRPVRLFGTVLDVTERVRAEQERQEIQASLAQSDRLASMGMLAAGVAHEINNPLSYVLYNLETLTQDMPRLTQLMRRCHAELSARVGQAEMAHFLGGEQSIFNPAMFEDALDRMRQALSGTQRIRNIAKSLGTFSRVEHVEVTPVSIQGCIEHAVTMASNELKFRARLVTDFSPVPAVLASEGKLAQVFLNLLINAAHAIDEGHVDQNQVRVRTWSEGGDVFDVFVEVSDTGKGIAPEHQAKIFEPFFTTKGVGAGSGLGLSICKKIITDLGGVISFISEPGRGTKFLVRLPSMPSGWGRDRQAIAETPSLRSTIHGRILVVDDEAGVRAIIVRMLRDDHDVVVAASGREGRAVLEKDRRFDIVFCDLMMPDISGMELHAWLAGLDPELAGKVVFITGGAFTPGAAEYLARVGNLRVEKPFDAVAVRKLANELLLAARSKRGA